MGYTGRLIAMTCGKPDPEADPPMSCAVVLQQVDSGEIHHEAVQITDPTDFVAQFIANLEDQGITLE